MRSLTEQIRSNNVSMIQTRKYDSIVKCRSYTISGTVTQLKTGKGATLKSRVETKDPKSPKAEISCLLTKAD